MPTVKPDIVPADIVRYAAAHGTQPDASQRQLIEETDALGMARQLQIGGEQGVLMEMLARLCGARSAIEIGTFTGYSALCLARGMGPHGRLICCDVSVEWTDIARRNWAAAGVADQIDLRIGPALDTIRSLPANEQFDLVFIDADKTNYVAYYDELVPRVRAGGLLMIDNTLWKGQVLDETDQSADTKAIRALNDHVAADARVTVVIVTIADGLTLALKN